MNSKISIDSYQIFLASASPRRRELLAQIGLDFEIRVSTAEERTDKTLPWEVVEALSRQKAENVAAELEEKIGKEADEASDKIATGSGEKAQSKVSEKNAEDVRIAKTGTGKNAENVRTAQTGTEKKALVIGADTVVAREGINGYEILGKPGTVEKAMEMLRSLQGGSHHVYTGVTLLFGYLDKEGRFVTEERKTFHEKTRVEFYPMTEEEIEEYAESGDPLDKAGAYGIQGFCARYIKGIEGDYNNVVGLPVGRLYQEIVRTIKERVAEGRMKKAVIFDLDGTVSDSLESIAYSANLALKPFGYGPFETQRYKYFAGDGAAILIERCLKAAGDEQLTHFDQVYPYYREIFKENCMYKVKPCEGVPGLLRALKERGVKIAVLSNKPHEEAVNVVETLFGKGYFDLIQGQKPGIPIKPDPSGVFAILKEWGLTAKDILYVGDTCTDMQTGKNAGAFSIGVLWGFRDREELSKNHADAIVENAIEILRYL